MSIFQFCVFALSFQSFVGTYTPCIVSLPPVVASGDYPQLGWPCLRQMVVCTVSMCHLGDAAVHLESHLSFIRKLQADSAMAAQSLLHTVLLRCPYTYEGVLLLHIVSMCHLGSCLSNVLIGSFVLSFQILCGHSFFLHT